LRGRRNPFVAREGIPFLLLSLLACWLNFQYLPIGWIVLPVTLTVLLFFVFKDPRRTLPSAPLGIVSPVDGTIVEITAAESQPFSGAGHKILFRIDSLGTYTARSPVEGHIMDPNSGTGPKAGSLPHNALWLRTDEGDNVLLQFRGYRLGVPPKSFARYGERLGQGARCAYLRLTRYAELIVPPGTKLLVREGQRVTAGSDLVGKLHRP
jgi:phosphatidylserine decarboxylase